MSRTWNVPGIIFLIFFSDLFCLGKGIPEELCSTNSWCSTHVGSGWEDSVSDCPGHVTGTWHYSGYQCKISEWFFYFKSIADVYEWYVADRLKFFVVVAPYILK